MLPNYNLVEAGEAASVFARAFGRKMIALIAGYRIKNYKLYRLLDDGTELIATRAHDQYRLTITTPSRSSVQPTEYSALWIPRGFVLYPSSSRSTSGWGTPVLRAGLPDPLLPDSLAPGLDVTRWTAGGYLGEVLLTKQVSAGYPKIQLELTPAFYSADETPVMVSVNGGKPTPIKKNYIQPVLTNGWTAYRVEFTDFSTTGGEGDSGSRKTVFHNAVAGAAYLPPVRGYYDPAARLVRNVTTADFSGLRLDDGFLSHAAVGYDTAKRRLNKDGVADSVAHDSVSLATNSVVAADDAATGAHLLDSTFTPARTSVSVALKNGMTAIAAVEHSQWVAYGNRYWIADDPAIPVVTWDGFPSWNWPIGLTLGTQVGGTFVDLDYFTVPVRGSAKKLFSKRVCANGREIGTVPDLVLSAGVKTTTDGGIVTDRLIVLTWRKSDQGTYNASYPLPPGGDGGEYSRVLRVYFADIPRRNGLSLLPDHAVLGLYDATTNPDGWHYAGQVELWQLTGSGADTTMFHGLGQPPQFKGDGTSAVFLHSAFDRSGGALNDISPFEIEFGTLGDGVLTYSIVNSVSAGHAPTEAHAFGQYCIGADYVQKSTTLQIISVMGAGVDKDGDGLHYADYVLRWSGVPHPSVNADASDLWYPINFETHDFFAGHAVYALDPSSGTFVVVHQFHGAPGDPYAFRMYYATGGDVPQSIQYTDAATVANGNAFAGIYLGNGSPALTCYARDSAGNRIAGYELAPTGVFEGSFFDSSVGDIGALTQTPGTDLRLFPIGVV